MSSDDSGAKPKQKKTIVYIDGFNLYYCLLRSSPYKWLDIAKFIPYLFPRGINDVVKIKYFSALVEARPSDPEQPLRQQMYWRALRTIPNLEIYKGNFITNRASFPIALCQCKKGKCKTIGQPIEVMRTTEKESDVNLATHLMIDAMKDEFEVAIVFTGDSDLAFPISQVKEAFNKVVIVVYATHYLHDRLAQGATFGKQVRKGAYLKDLQFPDTLQDDVGTITIPAVWKNPPAWERREKVCTCPCQQCVTNRAKKITPPPKQV